MTQTPRTRRKVLAWLAAAATVLALLGFGIFSICATFPDKSVTDTDIQFSDGLISLGSRIDNENTDLPLLEEEYGDPEEDDFFDQRSIVISAGPNSTDIPSRSTCLGYIDSTDTSFMDMMDDRSFRIGLMLLLIPTVWLLSRGLSRPCPCYVIDQTNQNYHNTPWSPNNPYAPAMHWHDPVNGNVIKQPATDTGIEEYRKPPAAPDDNKN